MEISTISESNLVLKAAYAREFGGSHENFEF